MNRGGSFEPEKQALLAAAQRLIDTALHSAILSARQQSSFRRALKLITQWPAIDIKNDLIVGVESLAEGDDFDEMEAIEFIINNRSLTLLAGGFVSDHFVGSQPIIEPELVIDIDGNNKNFELMPIRMKLLVRILNNNPTFYIKQKRMKRVKD